MVGITHLKILLDFSDTLGRTLLTGAQNKSRQSADAPRHTSKLWLLYIELLGVVPGTGLGRAILAAQGSHRL